MKLSLSIVALILALGSGYYLGTRSCNITTTSTTSQTVDTAKDIKKTITKHVNKDGSSDEVTVVEDHSKIDKQVQAVVSVKSASAPDKRISLSALTSNFREADSYTLSLEKRIAGPLWLGINYNTKQVYGLSVAWEF